MQTRVPLMTECVLPFKWRSDGLVIWESDRGYYYLNQHRVWTVQMLKQTQGRTRRGFMWLTPVDFAKNTADHRKGHWKVAFPKVRTFLCDFDLAVSCRDYSAFHALDMRGAGEGGLVWSLKSRAEGRLLLTVIRQRWVWWLPLCSYW